MLEELELRPAGFVSVKDLLLLQPCFDVFKKAGIVNLLIEQADCFGHLIADSRGTSMVWYVYRVDWKVESGARASGVRAG